MDRKISKSSAGAPAMSNSNINYGSNISECKIRKKDLVKKKKKVPQETSTT